MGKSKFQHYLEMAQNGGSEEFPKEILNEIEQKCSDLIGNEYFNSIGKIKKRCSNLSKDALNYLIKINSQCNTEHCDGYFNPDEDGIGTPDDEMDFSQIKPKYSNLFWFDDPEGLEDLFVSSLLPLNKLFPQLFKKTTTKKMIEDIKYNLE